MSFQFFFPNVLTLETYQAFGQLDCSCRNRGLGHKCCWSIGFFGNKTLYITLQLTALKMKPYKRFQTWKLIIFRLPCSFFWSNYSDLTRPGPPKCSWGREIPLFRGNPGWWNIIIWPDFCNVKFDLLGSSLGAQKLPPPALAIVLNLARYWGINFELLLPLAIAGSPVGTIMSFFFFFRGGWGGGMMFMQNPSPKRGRWTSLTSQAEGFFKHGSPF